MGPVLVAAAKFELDPLASSLEQRGITPETKLTGIGIVNAAKRARQIAEGCRGRHVIFVGTCGGFSHFSRVSLIRATEVLWLPTCERLGFSYTVKDSAPPIALPESPAWCHNLPSKRVICSPGVSLVSTLPAGMAADSVVENLELYGCISEIAAVAASVAVILAITNAVGPDSHMQWRQHYTGAAGLTAEYISTKLGTPLGRT